MVDVLLLLAAGFVCMVGFVAETVREDRRSIDAGGEPVSHWTWQLWLWVATGCLAVGAGGMLWWSRLFSS